MMILILLLLSSNASVSSAAPAATPTCSQSDLNARGFCELKVGQFKKAHELFNQAISKKPTVYAYVNRARTGLLLNPSDECPFETNGRFIALSDLQKAFLLDSKTTLFKLKENQKKWFNALKKSSIYAAWSLTTSFDLVKSNLALKDFIRINANLFFKNPGSLARHLYFSPSGDVEELDPSSGEHKKVALYKINRDRLNVQLGEKVSEYRLEAIDWYFDQGQKMIRLLILKSLTTSITDEKLEWFGQDLRVGQFQYDCEE